MATDYGFEGKDFPGYGYPIYNGLIEGMRFGPAADSKGATTHYKEYLDARGKGYPKVLEAHYGDNPGKQSQEMYALHSGSIEDSFEHMVAEDTIDLMRSMKAKRDEDGAPFFIWTNFWGPHTPCLIPEPYYSMYDPADIPKEPSFDETWAAQAVRPASGGALLGALRGRMGAMARDRGAVLGLRDDDRRPGWHAPGRTGRAGLR